MKIRIACVLSADGRARVCGPWDFDESEHHDAMSAARTWTAESGEIIVGSYWADIEIPAPETEAKTLFVETAD